MPPEEITTEEVVPGTTEGAEQNLEPDAEGVKTEDEATGDDATGVEADGDKTGEEDQVGAPETYADFSMPEGVELNAALLEKAVPVFKELNLTQEQAQKLADLQSQNIQAGEAAQIEAYDQMMDGWWKDTQANKEIGGDKLEESLGLMRKAAAEGPPEFQTLMDEYGLSKNQYVIQFMAKMGRYMSEDIPGANDKPNVPKKDRASVMYPT